MPRIARVAHGGMVFHALNRGVGRSSDDTPMAMGILLTPPTTTSWGHPVPGFPAHDPSCTAWPVLASPDKIPPVTFRTRASGSRHVRNARVHGHSPAIRIFLHMVYQATNHYMLGQVESIGYPFRWQ